MGIILAGRGVLQDEWMNYANQGSFDGKYAVSG